MSDFVESAEESPKPLKQMAKRRLEKERAAYRSIMQGFRARILGGLAITLPIAITYAVVAWMYSILKSSVIQPLNWILEKLVWEGTPLPDWYKNLAAPILVIFFALAILYFLGLFVRSRLHNAIDSVLLHVPVVTTIYGAVRNMFSAFRNPSESLERKTYKRAVLVPFPHPGMRVPGFVTATCRDSSTGKTILSVYVPTTPIPTTGYMLLIPEEDVSELDWDFEETLQAVISGGFSVPAEVRYFKPEIAIHLPQPGPS